MVRRSAAARVLVFAALLLPLATAGAPVHYGDAIGDQDFDLYLVSWHPLAFPYEGADDLCQDPRSDIVDVVVEATSARIAIAIEVADASAPVTCEGDIALQPADMDRFPFFRFTLTKAPGGNGAIAATVRSVVLSNGTFEQCVSYAAAPGDVCTPQAAHVIELATVYMAPGGQVADLRGASYALGGYSLDSYGVDDPKWNQLIFEDRLSAGTGFPIVVPS